jgi:uncharacterized membrane protein YdjX (TVP38/TMEM64 family)
MGTLSKSIKWTILGIVILALIVVPSFLFGADIDHWVTNFIKSAGNRRLMAGFVLAGILASDIFLPIPSNLISTVCGYLLGFFTGTLVSLAGMTTACVIGYWFSNSAVKYVAEKMVGDSELQRLQNLNKNYGNWMLVVCRPVPVLAEASVLFSGISGMKFRRFIILTTLSNLGISGAYSAIGTYSASAHSFLLAFLLSLILPALAMWLSKDI